MNKKIITLFLLFSINAHAYIPTIESLLRNGGNQDIGNNTVVGILNIERIIKPEESELENIPRKNAIKVLIGNEDPDRPSFIQIDYRDAIVSDSTMNRVHLKKNVTLERLGFKDLSQIEASIFYSLLSSLLSNNANLFMELLNNIDPAIKRNVELINKDQQKLLGQYRYYLNQMASKEEGSESPINPLVGETEDAKLKIKEILRSTYIVNDGLVKRVRDKNKFYLDLESPFIYARFDGENHRLKRMVITTEQGKIEVDCYNYILFNGKLEFPEIIYFKDLSGQMYKIKMSKIYSIKDQSGAFLKRLHRYEKILNKNPEKNSEIIKPSFLL